MNLYRNKKWISTTLAALLMTGSLIWMPTTASAGQKEWATAGKILAGAAGVLALDHIFNNRGYNAYPPPQQHYYTHEVREIHYEPVYRAQPVVEYRVVRPTPPPRRPAGHYEIQQEEVWVPGTYERQWVPPVVSEVWNGRCYVTREVQPGFFERVWIPGHYEQRQARVWVEGY
ncbi:MAG: hypothetical protein PHG55_10715 [Verrucomicrobiota bacterium]|nr:hypothetical protein [Verrucomicrobiota bacterium]